MSPISIFLTRGIAIESTHKVLAVVNDSLGNTLECHGDYQNMIFPRSSLKPFQVLPLISSGAQEAFNVSEKELAIACGSHSGEDFHLECVRSWLDRLGMKESDLECGVHPSTDLESSLALLQKGTESTQLNNNCSGKHTAMLCLSKHLGIDYKNYSRINHRVQIEIKAALELFSNYKLDDSTAGIDGCSVPTWLIPIGVLAELYATLGESKSGNKVISIASKKILEACLKYPEYLSGTNKYCAQMMKLGERRLLIKGGAEGVMAAKVLGERNFGIAIKCIDGSGRAAEAVMNFFLDKYGVIKKERVLDKWEIKNWKGIKTGEIIVDL